MPLHDRRPLVSALAASSGMDHKNSNNISEVSTMPILCQVKNTIMFMPSSDP